MVLDAENPVGFTFGALYGVVQEVDVGDGEPGAGDGGRVHGIAVVLGGNLNFPRARW